MDDVLQKLIAANELEGEAKKFVEKHGGKIWCNTELGRGTTFCFTIPYTSKEDGVYRQ